jgi:hypothetical protein
MTTDNGSSIECIASMVYNQLATVMCSFDCLLPREHIDANFRYMENLRGLLVTYNDLEQRMLPDVIQDCAKSIERNKMMINMQKEMIASGKRLIVHHGDAIDPVIPLKVKELEERIMSNEESLDKDIQTMKTTEQDLVTCRKNIETIKNVMAILQNYIDKMTIAFETTLSSVSTAV